MKLAFLPLARRALPLFNRRLSFRFNLVINIFELARMSMH